MFEGSSADLSERDYLNEDLLDRSSRLVPKTENSQVRQRCVVVSQIGYEKSQRGGEDRWRNKIYPVVGGRSNTKARVYHHIINWY